MPLVSFHYDRRMTLRRHFTEHPASVGETYTEHMRVAAKCAGTLAVAAGAAAVHAVVPSLCQTTASRRIRSLHDMITSGARGEALRGAADAPAA